MPCAGAYGGSGEGSVMASWQPAFGVAVLLLAGCSTAPPGDGLVGSLVAVDDTGLSDTPISDGWIVAVPQARGGDRWALGGLQVEPTDIGHVGFEVDEAALGGLDAAVAAVDRRGHFRLDAPPGPSVVCQLRPTDRPGRMLTMGCAAFDVPDAGRVEASFGEGGFFVDVS